MEIMPGGICGPGLELENVTSARVPLAGTESRGFVAKGLDTTVFSCTQKANHIGDIIGYLCQGLPSWSPNSYFYCSSHIQNILTPSPRETIQVPSFSRSSQLKIEGHQAACGPLIRFGCASLGQ